MEEVIIPSSMVDLKLSMPLMEREIRAYRNVPYYCGEVNQNRTWRGKSNPDLTFLGENPRSRRFSNTHSLCQCATCSGIPIAPFKDPSNGLKGIHTSKEFTNGLRMTQPSKESTYRLIITHPTSKKTWTMEQNPSNPNALPLRSDSKNAWTIESLNASMEQDPLVKQNPSSPNAFSPSKKAWTMEPPNASPPDITAALHEECKQCNSNHRRATSFGILALVFCLIIIILIVIILCLNRQKDCDIKKLLHCINASPTTTQ